MLEENQGPFVLFLIMYMMRSITLMRSMGKGMEQLKIQDLMLWKRQIVRRTCRKRVYRRQRRIAKQWFALVGMPSPRREWVSERSTDWWENFVLCSWRDEQWMANFRMTRNTFNYVVETVRSRLSRDKTNMREPVPVEKRVAAAIWYLANANIYRQVEQQFGLGQSTVGKMVLEFCYALEITLYKRIVCFGQDVSQVMCGFSELGMPHCVGAIDGCHIAINNPHGRVDEYGNRKNYSSILLQGTVDHKGRFIDAETGWAGRNNDAGVFTQSNLCRAMDAGSLIPGDPVITIQGVTIPAIMIVDGAYPMRRWLMTPYRNPAGGKERHYCYRLSRARNVVERAFGRLKSRWRCLSARLKVSPVHAISVIVACVILHNICEDRGHTQLPEEVPKVIVIMEENEDYNPHQDSNLEEGRVVREAIANFMWANRRVP